MKVLRLTAIAALGFVFLGASAGLAQTAGAFPCGRVTAYVAPTASSSGSITIGTSRFELAAGSAPDREIAVGSDVCIDGPRNAASAFTQLTVNPMAQGTCGNVTAYTPPTATAAGSITLSAPNGTFTLPVAPGVTLSRDQVTGGQCFTIGVNAQGNAEVVRYSGPWSGAAAPAATPRGLPSTTMASPAGESATQQGGTAAPPGTPASPGAASPGATVALAAAAAVLGVGLLLALRARRGG